MKDKTDVREFTFEMRAATEDEPAMLIGYAARFNTWSEDLGYFKERIKPGAFKNALMTSDVRALYNHDSNQLPLGRTPKTLRLAEDTKGLKVEIDMPDTQLSRDLQTSINRGDVSQMSFGFTVAEGGDVWVEKDGTAKRTITEVKELFDVSPVVYPAYKATKIAVRTLEKLEELKSSATAGDDKDVTVRDEQTNLRIDILTIENREV